MKKFTKTTLSIVAILACSLFFVQCKDAKDSIVTKLLQAQADKFNKECPMNMGGITIDSMKVEREKTLKTYYTVADSSLDAIKADGFVEKTKKAIVESTKSQPDMKLFLDSNVEFICTYYNEAGNVIEEIKITAADYK